MPNNIHMVDVTSADKAPAGFKAYAGYVDGHFQSLPGLVERFYPHAHIFSITVFGNRASCLDIEPGNPVPPSGAGAWVRRMRAQGVYRPCIYADRSEMPAVIASLAGMPRHEYRLWVANPDGIAEVPAGFDAKQFKFHGDFDESVMLPDFFPVKQPPRKRPPTSIHPKVGASALAGGIATAVFAYLSHHGVHITGAEHSAVTGLIAILAGYLTPSR